MAMEQKQVVNIMNRLAQLGVASERGFGIAAENVKNRGLKILFKSYAQERAQFSSELRELVHDLGGAPAEGSNILAAGHRGWINMKAAMTIGASNTEMVVLGEAMRGERVALRNYASAVAADLPANVHAVVARQQARIIDTVDRLRELQGEEGERLVLRLFDSSEDLREARERLADVGFGSGSMEEVPLGSVLNVYEGKRVAHTTAETALAGAFVGAVLGALLGLVAAISALVMPGEVFFSSMGAGAAFFWTIILGLLAGVAFGALIGAIIGVGVSQQDTYDYAASLQRGSVLLFVRSDPENAKIAADIMRDINARRWRLAS